MYVHEYKYSMLNILDARMFLEQGEWEECWHVPFQHALGLAAEYILEANYNVSDCSFFVIYYHQSVQ